MSPLHLSMRRLLYFALSLLLFGMDRGTKALVAAWLPLNESVPVVEGFFQITHVANTGALFGLLAGLGPPLRGVVFIGMPLVAIALILFFQIQSCDRDALTQIGLALILGGAVGNLYDRIRFGHVVDFLYFSISGHYWPAFNLADSCICVGVFILMLDLYRRERRTAPAS